MRVGPQILTQAIPLLSRPLQVLRPRVRVLTADDAEAFRDIRLQAIREEPALFNASKDELHQSLAEWEKHVTPTHQQASFGLFDGKTLIGIMSTKPWTEDESGKTAHWGSTFVMQEYRGQGIAKRLYLLREAWTQEHHFHKAVFYITDFNERSIEVHTKNGAVYTGRTDTFTRINNQTVSAHLFSKDLR